MHDWVLRSCCMCMGTAAVKGPIEAARNQIHPPPTGPTSTTIATTADGRIIRLAICVMGGTYATQIIQSLVTAIKDV
jgi:hypothetical protein